ncbi:hypothetical protein LTR70_003764 [Exophiala xenobiotica]|uniref:GAR domain-containing protein n=1 Tax=Lithohypha guttulata TaxID=1690604 RepID=A0ABR0KF83_9EURO|nr:hypothetical protein LTR24_003369 [Lithohypha guttulata]KAK5322263.1 hypothetical protein LTR70_003764 [Exophiala xenobiotica]
MAAGQPHPNPTDLTVSTKLPPSSHARTFSKSRSPSRSPTRKAQFAARELDPLLKNLSPDSILEALQATNALGGNQAEHNAIAKSISDASEAERELGIRAAVAAKKLREWTEEVTSWPWPGSQDRAWGAGFVPPTTDEQGATPAYCGSLPKDLVKQREDRLDEIWDAIDTLGMDEIKDYVFSSHQPGSRSASNKPMSAYGRMRDFTALVTATVIQALPVLANLHNLLESWSIRLTVLRQIPDLLTALHQVKLALETINEIVQDDQKSRKLTKRELDTGKVIFGDKVSNLGKRVDNMLDLLEGQEDSLPRAWIDSLEDIENKYADWVAQAEKVVLRNQMGGHVAASRSSTPHATPVKAPPPESVNPSSSKMEEGAQNLQSRIPPDHSSPGREITVVKRKPLLEINPKAEPGHRRGVSEVSMANSMLSNYSLENAEIIDATATPVMPSPRISVIDHTFPGAKNGTSSWMTSGNNDPSHSPPRPAIIQRASTASVGFVPKEQIRKVMLRRSDSSATPSTVVSPSFELGDPLLSSSGPYQSMTPLVLSPSPSLRVDPLSLKGRELAQDPIVRRPLVPRRSSKRLSMPLLDPPKRPLSPTRALPMANIEPSANSIMPPPATSSDKVKREETFDDKLKNILASMPTKIRLTAGSDSGSSGTSSQTSSRASSPTHALKLSPVRDKSGRNGTASSGIRVYHLRRGKSRDAPPLKLYVRAVGENGERVMVRVGGGWADLAEYLREYSLHHGGRSLQDRKLEVAGYPSSNHSKSSNGSLRPAIMPADKKPTVADQDFDFGLKDRPTSPEKEELESNPWRPPPMPIGTHPDVALARSGTYSTPPNKTRGSTPTPQARPSSRVATTVTTTPSITTTTTSNNRYTPLGGAGPVAQNRRATSQIFTRTPSNDAWVEGMVNQARSVSGSQAHHQHSAQHGNTTPTSNTRNNTTVVTTPTTVTTTMVSSARKYGSLPSRRFSSWSTVPAASPTTSVNTSVRPAIISSPQGSQLSQTSSGSSRSYVTANASKTNVKNEKDRRKSRTDFSGIRRVFLRKKSDK